MVVPHDPFRAVERMLVHAAPGSVRGLRRELGLTREAAAEVYAATSALVPGGLAQRTRRRPLNARAAVEVVKKYGRPTDVAAPELGIAGRVAREELSPRLGGLLGEAGPRTARWIAARTGQDEQALGRAVAVTAPIVLGALGTALEPRQLGDWIAMLSEAPLAEPERLPQAGDPAGRIYRRLRRFAHPWWRRWATR